MPDAPQPAAATVPADATVAPRRFRDWTAGHRADIALRRDVPSNLVPVLQQWIRLACRYDDQVAQRVGLRLGLEPHIQGRGEFSFVGALAEVRKEPDVLEVINAILGTHRAPDWFDDRDNRELARNYGELVVDLINALEDAGSAYTVADNGRQLVERVDPTVAAAVRQTIDTAEPSAATMLREAWNQAYGLHPDPTTAYREAVRAVEQVACPLVLPTDPKATLGRVIGELRSLTGQRWRFVLADKDGNDDVAPLVAMMDRLWAGQVSRHAGGPSNRDQTQEEARAAVHLAATLVQLLATGALTRRGQA